MPTWYTLILGDAKGERYLHYCISFKRFHFPHVAKPPRNPWAFAMLVNTSPTSLVYIYLTQLTTTQLIRNHPLPLPFGPTRAEPPHP